MDRVELTRLLGEFLIRGVKSNVCEILIKEYVDRIDKLCKDGCECSSGSDG